MSTYLTIYRIGDIVDIKANAAQQKGMPHKYYHGYVLFLTGFDRTTDHSPCRRTGIVYNVTPGAVGVIVHKIVGNRYIEKRVNIRIEHVRHSKCRQEFLDRVKSNTEAHSAAKEKGGECVCHIWWFVYSFVYTERVNLKRKPALPRESHVVSIVDNAPQTMRPVPYETTI